MHENERVHASSGVCEEYVAIQGGVFTKDALQNHIYVTIISFFFFFFSFIFFFYSFCLCTSCSISIIK